MKCQDIQNKLLTDFLDSELVPAEKIRIEAHLAGCASCREFLLAVKKINEPLEQQGGIQPPGHVWAKIREEVLVVRPSVLEHVRSWFEEVLWGFRPTFVYGTMVAAMCVVLIVPVGLYQQQAVARVETEELMQLVYADDTTTTAIGAETIGSGTAVEYWL